MTDYIIHKKYEKYVRECQEDGKKPMSFKDFYTSYEDMINDQ